LTFITWLFVDVGVIVIIILFLCPKKWLFSYVPLCPQNLKTRFTTSIIGIAIRLIANLLLTKIGIKHGS
jgi:hypothetical protein